MAQATTTGNVLHPGAKNKLTSCSMHAECGPPRTKSRSVSWNATGTTLAIASSTRTVRLWSVEGSGSKEMLSIPGHTAPVTQVRFHPSSSSSLVSSAVGDSLVRFWDARVNSSKSTGTISLSTNHATVMDVRWNPIQTDHLAVTERNMVHVYDVRNLAKSVHQKSLHLAETVIFDSITGEHLIAGVADKEEGMGTLQVWKWKMSDDDNEPNKQDAIATYPAHAGPIYALAAAASSCNKGRHILATGGADAVAGLWDLQSMCIKNSMTRCYKFFRGIAISKDGIVALSSEEDAIDLLDLNNGTLLGLASLSPSNRSNNPPRNSGGAEEIAFHPTEKYLLACARANHEGGGAPVSVLKLTF